MVRGDSGDYGVAHFGISHRLSCRVQEHSRRQGKSRMHEGVSIRHGWLDPGADTGYALYAGDRLLEMGELPWGVDGLAVWTWIEEHKELDVMGAENYRILPEKWQDKRYANVWSENHESQIIGGVRMAGHAYGFEVVVQEPAIKPAGYAFAGLTYVKGKKKMHMQDAVAHGAYWWMMTGRKRDS